VTSTTRAVWILVLGAAAAGTLATWNWLAPVARPRANALDTEARRLSARAEVLRIQNIRLIDEIDLLRGSGEASDRAWERLARLELGLIREDEVVLWMDGAGSPVPAPAASSSTTPPTH